MEHIHTSTVITDVSKCNYQVPLTQLITLHYILYYIILYYIILYYIILYYIIQLCGYMFQPLPAHPQAILTYKNQNYNCLRMTM